jgi:hypothetical protein
MRFESNTCADDLRLGSGEQVEWVLQKYVEKPLLVNKKKFHLRVHVLAVGRYRAVSFVCVPCCLEPDPLAGPAAQVEGVCA